MKWSFLLSLISLFIVLENNYPNGFSGNYEFEKGWRAGVAKVAITPEEPVWMAGYAARNRPSEGVLHDLWAKALVLEDENGNTGVIVTTDLIGFRGSYMSDRIRQRLNRKYGLSVEQVVLSSSHTHTGPELYRGPDEYFEGEDFNGQYNPEERLKIKSYSEDLENKIVSLVGRAIDSMGPAHLFSGNGVARFAVNRRNNTESDLNPVSQLAGPVDHSVPVLKIENNDGSLIAIMFGYACHATVLSFYMFSGDYPGFAQIELEETFPGAIAMFFAGAGADQNPLPRRSVGLAKQYGKTLAAAVEGIISEQMKELSPSLSMAHTMENLAFASHPPTREELLSILEDDSGYPGYLKVRAKVLLDNLENGIPVMTSYDYPIQFWRIGEQPLVILGGEVVVDYSLKLKDVLGEDLFVMAYANEGMGYIPSARVLREGGYEGSRSPVFTIPWQSDIEIKILGAVYRLAERTAK